jgi:hypothetical protein
LNTTRSLCPVVRAGDMTLFERVEVGGTARYLPLTRRILWLRESQTVIVLRHDGIDVDDDRATMTDWCGFLTSLTQGMGVTDDAARLAARFKIGPGDRLSVDLDVTIRDIPVLEDTSPDARREAERWAGKEYRKSYVCVPTWYGRESPWYLTDTPDGGMAVPPHLEPVEVAAVKAIYSTARHPVGVIPPDVAAWVAEQKRAAGITEGRS